MDGTGGNREVVLRIASDNQDRLAARQVIGGPDSSPRTHSSVNAQLFRQATASTIINGTSAEQYMQPGLENEIDRMRQAVAGTGKYFTGTA